MRLKGNHLHKGLAVFLEDGECSVKSAIITVLFGVSYALEREAGSLGSPLPCAIRVSPVQGSEFTHALYQSPARSQPQGWGDEWSPGGRV